MVWKPTFDVVREIDNGLEMGFDLISGRMHWCEDDGKIHVFS